MLDLSSFLSAKIVSALRTGTGRAFHKAEPDVEKALDPVRFLCEEQQIYLNLWSVDILSISAEKISQARFAGWLSLGLGKLLRIF